MNFPALVLRFRWLNFPAGLLILLLQRTPAPLLRVLVQLESLVLDEAPVILRSAFAVAAMGTYNSVAGATVFNVTATPNAATPASGAAKATFAVDEPSGAAMSVAVSVSGAPGNPRSYSITGALPAGLSITGGTATYVNVTAPYKMTIAGTPTAAGSYPVRVTAWDGTNGTGGNSAYITLNFTITGGGPANVAPSFTTQPTSQSVTTGGSVTFTVAASGTPTPTYQWQKGGTNLSGATSASLTLNNVQSADAGNYTAVATNAAGSATSSAATLTVTAATTAPAFTSQPTSQSVTVGGSATFTCTASGNPAPTYQWQKGGVNLAGATSATLALSNVQSGDAGNYTAVATNSAGTATSSVATLTVTAAPPANTAPTISTQPASQTVTVGSPVTFSVSASGNPAPTYQWKKDGANLAGATSASYSIAAAASTDAGTYTVFVSNSAGSATSSGATLTVNAASGGTGGTGGGTGTSGGPVLTTTLAAQTVTTGHPATFTAQAVTGTYQWQVSANNGSTWSNLANNATYSGVTTRTLTVNADGTVNGYLFRYVVTDTGGSTTSNSAALTVINAFFPRPTGIAVAAGTLYVTDASTNTVSRLTPAGDVTLWAGSAGNAGTSDGYGTDVQFNQPGGLAATAAGVLFVADSANATIRQIAAGGAVTTLAGSATLRGNADGSGALATFSQPQGVALDAAGNLYVADATNHTIRKITPAGVVSTLAGSAGQAGSANGTGAAARFNSPTGVAVDSAGNVFVSDRNNHTLRRISAAGAVTTFAGVAGISGPDNGTGGAALFNLPAGLAFDAAGNLYVADSANCTIRKVTPAGAVTTLAGLPTVAGLQDGTGLGALFNQPGALTADASGNLYVADTGNAAIRLVTPAGVVTTLSLRQGTASVPTGTTGSGSTGGGTSGSTSGGTSSGSGSGTSSGTPSNSGGGGGGGGAPSPWFLAGLGALSLLRGLRRRAAVAGR